MTTSNSEYSEDARGAIVVVDGLLLAWAQLHRAIGGPKKAAGKGHRQLTFRGPYSIDGFFASPLAGYNGDIVIGTMSEWTPNLQGPSGCRNPVLWW